MNNKGKELISEFNRFVDSSIEKEEFDFDKALEYLILLSKTHLEVILYIEIAELIANFYEASKMSDKEHSCSNIEAINATDKFLDELIDIDEDDYKKSLIDFKSFLVFG